ncbi:MAG: WecB/TagA/CpsF family glycosyltransferase [Patescibacteria group bacterium]|nr:WecB/TagA/CpsF family glycosyltransferase [Patescibacteria group bacterium]
MIEVNILGVKITSLTLDQLREKLERFLSGPEPRQIVTPNPEFCVQATHDQEFKTIINKAALAIPDGIGLKFAGWYLGTPIKRRITGVALVEELCRLAEAEGAAIFLLGGGNGVAGKTAEKLKIRYSKLKIVGAENENTIFGKKRSDDEIVKRLNRKKPDILLVAFGAPKQEKWIYYNQPKFTTIKIAAGVGGAFDYLSGKVKRAPRLLRIIGLEWLVRLIRQPWRISRIINATLIFTLKVLFSRRNRYHENHE